MWEKDVDRREFLGEVAAAAAAFSVGLAAGGLAAQKAQPKDPRPIKFGVIGTGAQGRFDLKQALRNPACECVAAADINPVNLAAGLKLCAKGARSYSDYREMLGKEKDLEAVLIAVPLSAHAQIALDALDAGKHVFVEKALAHTLEQCRAVCKKAKATGKWVQVGHQRRYNPLYAHAMKLIKKEKVLGQVTTIRAQWHRNGSWRRAVPRSAPGIDFNKWGYQDLEHLINWRLYQKHSGGLMAELGGHQIDVVNWLLGMTPIRVAGIGGLDWYKDGRDVFDNVQCVFDYPGGIKMVYTSICTNAHDGYGEQIMGNGGTLVMLPRSGLLFRERNAREVDWMKVADKTKVGGKSAISLDTAATAQKGMEGKKTAGKKMTGKKRSHRDDYRDEFASFFDCIRSNKRPLCSEVEGMESAVTVIMANRAMRQNATIELKPELFKA